MSDERLPLSGHMYQHADTATIRFPRWWPKSLQAAWRGAWNAQMDLIRTWAGEVSQMEVERCQVCGRPWPNFCDEHREPGG